MRKHSTSCETCPNDSSRPPLRRSRHKQTSPRGLGVVGDAPERPGERCASADRSWLGTSADAVSACGGCADSALDQPRSRSSELIAGAASESSRSGVSASPESKLTYCGMSKFLHDGRLGGVREHDVGPFPPATISRDRAIDRIGLDLPLPAAACYRGTKVDRDGDECGSGSNRATARGLQRGCGHSFSKVHTGSTRPRIADKGIGSK
jgi:hypothetical protein